MRCNQEEILKQCKILKEEIDGLKEWELYNIDISNINNAIDSIVKETKKEQNEI